jgi:hypothetical protein
MSECTFKPRINTCRTTASRLEESRPSCKCEVPAFPFSPTINPLSEELVKTTSFEERQRRFISSKMMNLAALTQQKLWSETIDSSTGVRLHVPKVGRAPKVPRA